MKSTFTHATRRAYAAEAPVCTCAHGGGFCRVIMIAEDDVSPFSIFILGYPMICKTPQYQALVSEEH